MDSTPLSTSLPVTSHHYPIPLTQLHTSPHQTIQNWPLQTGPHNHHSKVLVTYLFGDGHERLSPSSHPLFVFVQPRQWLKRNNLTTALRTILQHCGLLANNFYSHSFCIRAATTATKVGLPPWLIKVLSHWSSDCYGCYIRTPKCTILEVPRLLLVHN